MPSMLILLLTLGAPTPTVAIYSGVTAADLASTPVINAVNMDAGQYSNQLSLTLAITPGTSATVDVTCYESTDNTTYGQIPLCDGQATSACAPDVRQFTLSEWATVGGVKTISTRWPSTKKWIKCSVDDPLDGSGTITITGSRSFR